MLLISFDVIMHACCVCSLFDGLSHFSVEMLVPLCFDRALTTVWGSTACVPHAGGLLAPTADLELI